MTSGTITSTSSPSTAADWRAELLSVLPHDRAHWGAVRAAVSVVVPIAALSLTGHANLTLFATFGAMAAVFGRHSSYAARLRMQVTAGLCLSASVFVGTLVGLVAPASSLAVVVIAALSLTGLLVARRIGLLPVPSLFMVFAAGSTSAFGHAPIDLVRASALPLAAAALAVGIGQLGRLAPPGASVKHPARPVVPFRKTLAAPGARLDIARYTLAPLLAGGIATAVGIGHPYWAAVAATVPLAGATLGAQLGRGTQRLAGTVLGLAIATAVLGLNPPLWVLLVVVAAAQVWAELFVMRNYALAVVGVTPLALVMVHLASPLPLSELVGDRLVETVIGVVVAVVLLIVTTPRRRAA
ncbi:hypothetical protein AX769_00085 [Frondihabitans sp. PAMC 28766]|uniref:FUSC family protein n=1 Tax=Frondihabitans sp. PAMC 28766 TaxID=1795630 RepID=UPI00078B97CB|nr:FUSC family protein [Frondihabitans sp. PAMC 28766]AMM18831.1 hypothetical protein AX769_00085 [Frondihabitans sp. PAMC 28766]